MNWSARQYVAFEDQRNRPIHDLLKSLPPIRAQNAIDLGCGPGNSTELLSAQFPAARISGLDTSPDMLAAAHQRLPAVHFELADIGAWQDRGPFDVILANAVLQWVPHHETVLPELMSRLCSGGALAIQMPDNLDSDAHRLMRETATQGPWSAKLTAETISRAPIAGADWYYQLLRPHAASVDVWRTTYHHPLAGGAAAVVEWFKGSGLRPFLAPLTEAERAEYLRRYTAAIAATHPALSDGSVLLPFPRLFIVAVR